MRATLVVAFDTKIGYRDTYNEVLSPFLELPATANRSYRQHCVLAQALNLVGDRWALLIVRELLAGAKRFSDLRDALDGVSPNVLAQRLADLQGSGILDRRMLPSPASAPAYALTRRGRGLRKTLESLVRWGQDEQLDPGPGPTSVASVVLLLEASFHAGAARQAPLVLRLTLGEEHLGVEVRDGCLNLSRISSDGPASGAAALFGPPARVADLILGRRTLDDVLAAGEVRLEGGQAEVERFLRLFHPPSRPRTGGGISVQGRSDKP